MADQYILTTDGFIENYQLGNSNILKDNQKLYLYNSVTGSTTINSKYDSSTDSFIEPIGVNNVKIDLLPANDVNGEIDFGYFTGSLPVTLSLNRDITTNPLPSELVNITLIDEVNLSNNYIENAIRELEISNNNQIQFKLEPSSSSNINWGDYGRLTNIEIRVGLKELEFDSLNDRFAASNSTYKTNVIYSQSVV